MKITIGVVAYNEGNNLPFLLQDIEAQSYPHENIEVVLADSGGEDTVVVTRQQYPTYRGALVVCQGGDQADVRLAVTEAVAALTGLSSDRVTVAKWQ